MNYVSDLGYIEVSATIDDQGDEIYIDSIMIEGAEVKASDVYKMPIGGCREVLEIIFSRVKEDAEDNICDIREYWHQHMLDEIADEQYAMEREERNLERNPY